MEKERFVTYRFVKSEDLNHHGTLFAGRAAEWFVETGLMTTSFYVPAENIVMVNINQMSFYKPIHLGELIKCSGVVAYAGRTSFIVYLKFEVDGEKRVEGFISYVNVDEDGKSMPHNIKLDLDNEEVKELNERAKKFLNK